MGVFICYDRCSTCQKVEKWLTNNKIAFEKRSIKEQNPTIEELKQWKEQSKLPLKRFFNTSGLFYRNMNLKDKLETMSEEQQLELLASDGMLVKRPLFISTENVLVGFKEKEWQQLLSE